MERHMLRLMLVLGVLVTILGGTGVFAVFSDQARGGPNTAESGARTHAADLLIASAVADYNASTVSCGRYTQNLETPQFAVSDLQPTSDRVESWVCLQNAGAAPLAIRVGSSSVSDLDVDCTGDEAAIGDATCGGLQAGELASRISVHVIDVDCRAFNSTSTHVEYLPSLAREPVQLRDAALAPGEQACVRLILDYDPFATEEQIQLAQSDRVTWSFIFEGTAS